MNIKRKQKNDAAKVRKKEGIAQRKERKNMKRKKKRKRTCKYEKKIVSLPLIWAKKSRGEIWPENAL